MAAASSLPLGEIPTFASTLPQGGKDISRMRQIVGADIGRKKKRQKQRKKADNRFGVFPLSQ